MASGYVKNWRKIDDNPYLQEYDIAAVFQKMIRYAQREDMLFMQIEDAKAIVGDGMSDQAVRNWLTGAHAKGEIDDEQVRLFWPGDVG